MVEEKDIMLRTSKLKAFKFFYIKGFRDLQLVHPYITKILQNPLKNLMCEKKLLQIIIVENILSSHY